LASAFDRPDSGAIVSTSSPVRVAVAVPVPAVSPRPRTVAVAAADCRTRRRDVSDVRVPASDPRVSVFTVRVPPFDVRVLGPSLGPSMKARTDASVRDNFSVNVSFLSTSGHVSRHSIRS
jgi:hypothetical protein